MLSSVRRRSLEGHCGRTSFSAPSPGDAPTLPSSHIPQCTGPTEQSETCGFPSTPLRQLCIRVSPKRHCDGTFPQHRRGQVSSKFHSNSSATENYNCVPTNTVWISSWGRRKGDLSRPHVVAAACTRYSYTLWSSLSFLLAKPSSSNPITVRESTLTFPCSNQWFLS